jgi:hypothetical protein
MGHYDLVSFIDALEEAKLDARKGGAAHAANPHRCCHPRARRPRIERLRRSQDLGSPGWLAGSSPLEIGVRGL